MASGAEGYRFEPCRGYLQHKDLRRELDEEKVLVTMIVTEKDPRVGDATRGSREPSGPRW